MACRMLLRGLANGSGRAQGRLGNRALRPSCRRPRISRRSFSLLSLALALGAFGGAPGPARAGEPSATPMQGLDEQVQEIKSDVLGIAAELSRLEERLLYPSNTQVAVFIALAENETSRLDSVRIQLDGELVTHHIYSFKELEALKKGGVQRIYTGNLPTGEHQLEVSIAGKLRGGRDFNGSESFRFDKSVGPKLVELTVAGTEFGNASIQLGDR